MHRDIHDMANRMAGNCSASGIEAGFLKPFALVIYFCDSKSLFDLCVYVEFLKLNIV